MNSLSLEQMLLTIIAVQLFLLILAVLGFAWMEKKFWDER
jgi:hypothetical protein